MGQCSSRPSRYSVALEQVGTLSVEAPKVTDEGFPPVRNVLPLVLSAS